MPENKCKCIECDCKADWKRSVLRGDGKSSCDSLCSHHAQITRYQMYPSGCPIIWRPITIVEIEDEWDG